MLTRNRIKVVTITLESILREFNIVAEISRDFNCNYHSSINYNKRIPQNANNISLFITTFNIILLER